MRVVVVVVFDALCVVVVVVFDALYPVLLFISVLDHRTQLNFKVTTINQPQYTSKSRSYSVKSNITSHRNTVPLSLFRKTSKMEVFFVVFF